MLNFRLIKIRFLHDFVAFVAKNVSKNVLESQSKFDQTNRFRSACVRHFENDAKSVFWENISCSVNRDSDKRIWDRRSRSDTRHFVWDDVWFDARHIVWNDVCVAQKISLRIIDDTLLVRIDDIYIEIDMKIIFRIQNLRVLIVERLILIVLRRSVSNHERFTICLRTNDASHLRCECESCAKENTILRCEEKWKSLNDIAVYWVFKYEWRLICWDCT